MKTTSATVIMLSYNFCHFEISKQIEGEHISVQDIDIARKEVQRLADKAIDQYQTAKSYESKRASLTAQRRQLEVEVMQIKSRHESEWSITDKAKVKALSDYRWSEKYDYQDDYEDRDY